MDDVAAGDEALGALIKRLREARNLSQERLEVLADYRPGSGMIAQIEGGTRGKRLSRTRAAALAQALRVPVTDILRAAGRLSPEEEAELRGRPTFEDFVNSDPELRVDQKRMLVGLYRTYVPRSTGAGGGGAA